jgi:hypothetical protein
VSSSSPPGQSQTVANLSPQVTTRIHEIRPRHGWELGGTRINVHVCNLSRATEANASWSCCFGNCEPPTMASAIPARSMVSGCYVWKCQTSPGRAGEGVDVKLARNGVVFARSAEGFMYDPVPAVESLVPSSGPFQHGFVLTVLGYHFLDGAHTKDQAVVRVGGDTFHGRVRSSSLLHCLVTARYPGNHSVEMSTNGVDFTEVRSRILIHEDFSVRAVHQISPSLGPSAGGMSVIIRIERMAEDQPEWTGAGSRIAISDSIEWRHAQAGIHGACVGARSGAVVSR